jgi:hypothetical protein
MLVEIKGTSGSHPLGHVFMLVIAEKVRRKGEESQKAMDGE